MIPRRFLRVLCAALALVACGDASTDLKDLLPTVSATVVKSLTLDEEIRASGDLEARLHTTVAAEIAGRVTGIQVEEGAPVEAGDVVLEIDPERRQLELDAARAGLAQARAEYGKERRQTTRVRKLSSENVASQQQLEEAEAALELARGPGGGCPGPGRGARAGRRRRQRGGALRGAGWRGAPWSWASSCSRGIRSSSWSRSTRWRSSSVCRSWTASGVRAGAPVELEVSAFPNRSFPGSVTFISPTIDPATRTLRVKAQVSNGEGLLRPGLFARGAHSCGTPQRCADGSRGRGHPALRRRAPVPDRRRRPPRAGAGEPGSERGGARRGARRAGGGRSRGAARTRGPGRRRPGAGGRGSAQLPLLPGRGCGDRAASRGRERGRRAVSLSDLSIRRPVLTWMMALALATFGVLGFMRLGVDRYPDMDYPYVGLLLVLDGAAPETMEEEVVDVLEEAFVSIEGLRHIRSESTTGKAVVHMEFELETDIDVAAQDVRDRLNLFLDQLPSELEPPILGKADSNAWPIVFAPISSDISEIETTEYVDKHLRPLVESIPGAANAQIPGGVERNIRIWIDPAALRARGLATSDVLAALRREHIDRPGGFVEGPSVEWALKTDAEFRSVEELSNMIVSWDGAGPDPAARRGPRGGRRRGRSGPLPHQRASGRRPGSGEAHRRERRGHRRRVRGSAGQDARSHPGRHPDRAARGLHRSDRGDPRGLRGDHVRPGLRGGCWRSSWSSYSCAAPGPP